MPPDFLAIGHVVKDITDDGWRIGGSVAYATLQAARLGLSVAGVTACSPEIDPPRDMPWADWHVLESPATTTFHNVYRDGTRYQRVLAQAAILDGGDVPDSWRQAPIVFLCPVIREVSYPVARISPSSSIVGVGAQGYLRWLVGSKVLSPVFQPSPAWLRGNAVFVSDEDMGTPERAGEWARRVPTVVLTRGARGCTIWTDHACYDVAAFPAREVDPTGAGDIFAAAFLVRLRETSDVLEAARFASAAASLVVQGAGLEAIGDRKAIDSILESARTTSS